MAKKETRAEKVKRERDALDCLDDLLRYAKEGFASIDPDDLDVRLRWYGLYTQRPQEDGYFMLRVKIPNGTLTVEQLATLGQLSVRYGQNTGDVTTRQDIQFHYIRIEDVPAIFEALNRVGLTTSGACGDITRNVTGCPLAGIDSSELIDAEPIIEQIHHYFLDNHEYSNLPRKFKITVSGCSQYCTGHEINDVGLIAVRRPDGRVAFDLWVGGGLGSKERFADRLGVHVFPEEAAEVTAQVCAIFRDYGFREYRHKARLKFLLEAWGPVRFRQELETRLGRQLTDGEAPAIPVNASRAHIGIRAQKQAGLHFAGVATERGRLNGTEMIAVANSAKRYGSNRIRLTTTQNLVVLDVPEQASQSLSHELAAIGLFTNASVFRTGTIACTGKRFCKLAVVETKARASELIEYLEATVPDMKVPLRISVTGCPNSCAHYQVCDVGLVGDHIVTPAGKIEAFRVFLGGHLGSDYRFGRELSTKVAAEEVKYYLERVVRDYLAHRISPAESFQAFLSRQSLEELEHLGSFEERAAFTA